MTLCTPHDEQTSDWLPLYGIHSQSLTWHGRHPLQFTRLWTGLSVVQNPNREPYFFTAQCSSSDFEYCIETGCKQPGLKEFLHTTWCQSVSSSPWNYVYVGRQLSRNVVVVEVVLSRHAKCLEFPYLYVYLFIFIYLLFTWCLVAVPHYQCLQVLETTCSEFFLFFLFCLERTNKKWKFKNWQKFIKYTKVEVLAQKNTPLVLEVPFHFFLLK